MQEGDIRQESAAAHGGNERWEGSERGLRLALPEIERVSGSLRAHECRTATQRLREQISDTDRTIVEAMNARLRLVAQIKRYKESRGLDFLDPEREEWMLKYLLRANRGPLSAKGLEELFSEVLDLTKREVERSETSPPPPPPPRTGRA